MKPSATSSSYSSFRTIIIMVCLLYCFFFIFGFLLQNACIRIWMQTRPKRMSEWEENEVQMVSLNLCWFSRIVNIGPGAQHPPQPPWTLYLCMYSVYIYSIDIEVQRNANHTYDVRIILLQEIGAKEGAVAFSLCSICTLFARICSVYMLRYGVPHHLSASLLTDWKEPNAQFAHAHYTIIAFRNIYRTEEWTAYICARVSVCV